MVHLAVILRQAAFFLPDDTLRHYQCRGLLRDPEQLCYKETYVYKETFMTKIITESLQGNIQHAFQLMDAYIETCPDKVWAKKFGTWPVWQQYYHAFTAIAFFLQQPGDPEETPPIAPLVGGLKEIATETPDKKVIKSYAQNMQAKALKYASELDDAALCLKNEGLSARFGRDISHAGTLALIASHTLYHLGSCDAALRENGIPGVF